MSQMTKEEGIIVEPETEALRLSAMIALFVGALIIMSSIDNFHQQQVPSRIGEAECSWWRTNFGGCNVRTGSLKQLTKPSNKSLKL